ncbi:MAG: hypothetical protein DRG24_06775 [Epsilonproteobacteria bacterium]|nr:MAG: hypothetical protein DRG24_06775 [Campylobacterota bacterium]
MEFKDKNIRVFLSEIILSVAVPFLLLSGCASEPEAQSELATGYYHEIATEYEAKKDLDAELDEANLLPTLQAGNIFLYAAEYDKSLKMLDEAERIVKFHHEEILLGSVADNLARLLLNDAVIDYHATVTDAVMINTYKALDYMILGQRVDARVELNRAVDRQRRAKETYSELIAKQNEAIDEKANEESGSMDVKKTVDNPEVDQLLRSEYPGLYAFQAYPEFINPFTTYLAGLFFAIEGDYAKSYSLLREVSGMMPDNETVQSDYEMVKKRNLDDNYIWVIYDNGLAPIRKEFRIDIPLFIVSDDISYTGIALPKMEVRKRATPYISVESQGRTLAKTTLLADMDRVILTEFQYEYPDIVARAIFSTLIKTALQYELEKQNSYLGLAAALFQMASTQADTRTWKSLPKEFQVARVRMPSDHKLMLRSGMHNISIEIAPNANHAIIYVRIPTAMSNPSYAVINF